MFEINRIYNEDNMITMSKIPTGFLDGICCSPPYNISTKRKDGYYNTGYSHIDGLSNNEYIWKRLEEFKEFSRIIKDDGVILYNLSYHNENPILPLQLITKIHETTNLTLADMISWKKKTSMPFQSSSNKLSRIVEQIYVIVKKSNLHTFKSNKEVSKINEKTGQTFYKYYHNFIEAANNDGIRCNLKASYSTELVRKLLEIYFPIDSIIYDPFSGIGTTSLACKKMGRNFVGSEIDSDFFQISQNRLSQIS